MKKVFLKKTLVLLTILLLTSSLVVEARTREKSVRNFLDEMRISVDGFANDLESEVTIDTTSQALEIASHVNYDVNNSYDVLLFYQKSQNEDGGFAYKPEETSDWDSTISAVKGLMYLYELVNTSQIRNWKIQQYINKTSYDLLYTNITVNNVTSIVPRNITLSTIRIWYEYISTTFMLGYYPEFNLEFLKSSLQGIQYPNGSYPSFSHAVGTINLLTLIGSKPKDTGLASNYIKAFIQENGAFSTQQVGKSTLNATYYAIRALDQLDHENIYTLENADSLLLFVLGLQHTNSGFQEVDRGISTVEDTFRAVKILWHMESLDELLAPDVLQTEGFIALPYWILFSPVLLAALVYLPRRNST